MKWKVLWVLGGIIGVALIVILILPSIINANRFRPKMESDLSLALNRKVSIGNVRLAILSGGVKVDDLSVADDPAFASEPVSYTHLDVYKRQGADGPSGELDGAGPHVE